MARHAACRSGAFPSPLWGGVGVGVAEVAIGQRCFSSLPPPPPTASRAGPTCALLWETRASPSFVGEGAQTQCVHDEASARSESTRADLRPLGRAARAHGGADRPRAQRGVAGDRAAPGFPPRACA